MSQIETELKPFDAIAAFANEQDTAPYERRQAVTIKKHLKCMEILNEWCVPSEIEFQLRRHLQGHDEKSKKKYSQSHVDNLTMVWRKVCETYAVSEKKSLHVGASVQWDQWLEWFEISKLEPKSSLSEAVDVVKRYFVHWLRRNPISPKDLTEDHVMMFGDYLRKMTSLNGVTSIPRILWAIRRVARLHNHFPAIKRITQPIHVLEEIEKYRVFATTPIHDPVLILNRRSGIHNPITWEYNGQYPTFMKLVMGFAASTNLMPKQIFTLSEILNFETINELLKSRIADQSITRNTAKSWVQSFTMLMVMAFELKEGRFGEMTFEQLEDEIYKIKKLKRKEILNLFKRQTRKDKLIDHPLPSPAKIAEQLDIFIQDRHGQLLDKLKMSDTIKKKADCAVKYRQLTELIHIVFIASRPHDIRKLEVTTTSRKSGARSVLWKLESGNFMFRYPPIKTSRDQNSANDVYVLWPPKYNFILDTYLKIFRPLLISDKPLLYPGSGFRMNQYNSSDRGGVRSATGVTKSFKILSYRAFGQSMSPTEFRYLITNWYFLSGVSGYVAFVLGHKRKAAELTSVELKHYLNLSPEDAEITFLNVYESLFKFVEQRKGLLDRAS